jgi:hypothetical protein
MQDLSAEELVQVEGGSFNWGEVGSPDLLVVMRRIRS